MAGKMNQLEKMQKWCQENARNPKVLAWIKENHPPKQWQGSELEWAYLEMPQHAYLSRDSHRPGEAE